MSKPFQSSCLIIWWIRPLFLYLLLTVADVILSLLFVILKLLLNIYDEKFVFWNFSNMLLKRSSTLCTTQQNRQLTSLVYASLCIQSQVFVSRNCLFQSPKSLGCFCYLSLNIYIHPQPEAAIKVSKVWKFFNTA